MSLLELGDIIALVPPAAAVVVAIFCAAVPAAVIVRHGSTSLRTE
jgi:hypothetical protein